MRAQDPGIIEPANDHISCVPSYISVSVHVLLLQCVQKVIVFMCNALAVQSDPSTPPSIYFRHNWAGLLCLIDIYVICDTPEQMSGGDICILNRPSPPHLPYPAYPSYLSRGMKMGNRALLPFSYGCNILLWKISGRSAKVQRMFSLKVPKILPSAPRCSNN